MRRAKTIAPQIAANGAQARGTMKPKLFVGSSREGLDVAYAVQEQLEHDAEVTVWTQGLFEPAQYTLDGLIKALDRFDCAVFVFSPDDAVRVRAHEYVTTRDNVLLEFGMFVGRLGPDRCFLLTPSEPHDFRLPTDLSGITLTRYRADRTDNNLVAAVGPACNGIRKALRNPGLTSSALPSNPIRTTTLVEGRSGSGPVPVD